MARKKGQTYKVYFKGANNRCYNPKETLREVA